MRTLYVAKDHLYYTPEREGRLVRSGSFRSGRPTLTLLYRVMARSPDRRWEAVGLAVLVLATALLLGRGLDDSIATPGNDEPRHAMNGVFLYDALRDGMSWRLPDLLTYARRYYARYPALSLGFHPPLLAAAEVPFVALVGAGLTAGRLTTAVFFIAVVLGLYALVARLYGRMAAGVSAVVCASNPTLLDLARQVMSETPAIALSIGTVFFLERFCARQRRHDLAILVVVAAASVYAKQLAGLLFPAYAIYAVVRLGPRRMLRRDTVTAMVVLAVLVSPLVPLTLRMSSWNVDWVADAAIGGGSRASRLQPIVSALSAQLSVSMLLLAGLGLARIVIQRDRRGLLLIAWLGAAMASVAFVTRGVEPVRYGIYMLPPLMVLVGAASVGWSSRAVRAAVLGLTTVAVGSQALAAASLPAERTPGYEAAARFVLDRPRGTTVLYSAEVDSGLFVLFTRKHDPARHAIVLRADKLFVTAALDRFVEDRISTREEIYDALRRFGVGYVVIEDRPGRSTVLNWLREETRSSRFAERFRTPIGSANRRLNGVSIAVYEFLEATAPDPAAVISMDIPVARSAVAVRLADVVSGGRRSAPLR